VYLALTGLAITMAACSADQLINTQLPSTVSDPAAVNTPQGAVDRYHGTIALFGTATSGNNNPQTFIVASGLLSDELTSGDYPSSQYPFTAAASVDSRSMKEGETDPTRAQVIVGTWGDLSGVRIHAQDAIYALTNFAPQSSPDLRGHMHVLQGMAEVMLAEQYCSGIPLDDETPGGGFVYGAGLSSDQVYTHAVAQFDTALTLISDSTTLLNFARVAKGRALLDLGQYSEAAQAVASVPTSFVYQNRHSTASTTIGVANFTMSFGVLSGYGTVADQEGGNGLNYISSHDPRTLTTDLGPDVFFPATHIFSPNKWALPVRGASPITIANGVEARLIEAEAALKVNDPSWLTTLNTLRTDGTQTGGVYNAGTGGVAGLAPLTDPGTADGRVSLLFRERAFWLFLTGHRQGDMRRLVRQYNRPQETVYPIGAYRATVAGSYGTDVDVPAPATEVLNNPNYHGCINRSA
jgi:hypothetical protein